MSDFNLIYPIIRKVFRDVGPIADEDLSPDAFQSRSSINEGLDELRKLSRYGLFEKQPWIDFGILYRANPYAIWHFAPSFISMMYEHWDDFEYEELARAFIFPAAALESTNSYLFVINEFKPNLERCLSGRIGSSLDARWFATVGSFYSRVEKMGVASFLKWLALKSPGDAAIPLTLERFWQRGE